jgi:hypothetical protein
VGLGLAFVRATRRIKVPTQPRLIEGTLKAYSRFPGCNAHRNPASTQGIEHFAHPVKEFKKRIAAEIMHSVSLDKFAQSFWRQRRHGKAQSILEPEANHMRGLARIGLFKP